jgi:hypothetical protein
LAKQQCPYHRCSEAGPIEAGAGQELQAALADTLEPVRLRRVADKREKSGGSRTAPSWPSRAGVDLEDLDTRIQVWNHIRSNQQP